MNKKKCLITGGSGLLGSFLVPQLENWEIVLISKPTSDLAEEDFVRCLPKKADAIIHLAQSNHFKEFPQKALDIFNVNTRATLKLLDYARQAEVKTFIYASSGAVYGSGPKPFVETDPLLVNPQLGIYYASKLSAELLVESYASYFTTVILRFFFIYGPGQREQMLIPRLVQSVMKGVPIKLQGNEGLRINPIFVTDAAQAVKAALDLTESSKINVGGMENLSLREIGQTIAQCLNVEAKFEVVSETKPVDLIGDTERLCNLLVRPKVTFQEGVKVYLESRDYCVKC